MVSRQDDVEARRPRAIRERCQVLYPRLSASKPKAGVPTLRSPAYLTEQRGLDNPQKQQQDDDQYGGYQEPNNPGWHTLTSPSPFLSGQLTNTY